MMNYEADLIEIFSSLQGEGPRVGEAMTFVRFAHCTFGCHWCDTPESFKRHETLRVEDPVASGTFRKEKNPVTPNRLNDLLRAFDHPTLSITGGEPLEQVAFLSQWLPTRHLPQRVLLETNGIHGQALAQIANCVDIISMDIKLPSSTGTREAWKKHEEFLRLANASGKELYVKIVVTQKTTDRDIERAIRLVNTINRNIPVILQPVSATLTFGENISDDRLLSLERLCQAYLPDVRIIPQMHKQWDIL